MSYSGTFDAFRKIISAEGFRALYKGFGVSLFGVAVGPIYLTTLEVVRSEVNKLSPMLNLSPATGAAFSQFVAGGCASLISQTVVVPLDVVTQRRMVMSSATGASPWMMAKDIARNEGIRGFFRGYTASILTYAPSSALFWGCFGLFRPLIDQPDLVPTQQVLVSGISGALAGIVSSSATNPIDVVRTRMQEEGGSRSLQFTIRQVITERAYLRGVSARVLSNAPTSALIMMCYDLLKRHST